MLLVDCQSICCTILLERNVLDTQQYCCESHKNQRPEVNMRKLCQRGKKKNLVTIFCGGKKLAVQRVSMGIYGHK